MIAIIDYGIGNLRSVHNAVSFISPQTKSIVTSDPDIVSKADKKLTALWTDLKLPIP